MRRNTYDPLADLRPRNELLRRLQELAQESEKALRNAEEASG